jgi:hypothetical protein
MEHAYSINKKNEGKIGKSPGHAMKSYRGETYVSFGRRLVVISPPGRYTPKKEPKYP